MSNTNMDCVSNMMFLEHHNDLEIATFAKGRKGSRLLRLFSIAMHEVQMANLKTLENRARKYLNRPEILEFRKELTDAGIIVKYKPPEKNVTSEYIEHKDFFNFFLYLAGHENAPKEMEVSYTIDIDNFPDPRGEFDSRRAGSFAALLEFILKVIDYHDIPSVDGQYRISQLIYGAGYYSRVSLAEKCLNKLIAQDKIDLTEARLVDREYFITPGNFVKYILPFIDGSIPKAVARANKDWQQISARPLEEVSSNSTEYDDLCKVKNERNDKTAAEKKVKSKALIMQELAVRHEEAKLEQEKEKTKLAGIQAKQEEEKAKQETCKYQFEIEKEKLQFQRHQMEEENKKAVLLQTMQYEHEIKLAKLQLDARTTTPLPPPQPRPTPQTSAKDKVHITSVLHIVQYGFNVLIEPSMSYGDRILGRELGFNLMAWAIHIRRTGLVSFFPSLNLFQREFDIRHYCAQIKQVFQDRGGHLYIPDRHDETSSSSLTKNSAFPGNQDIKMEDSSSSSSSSSLMGTSLPSNCPKDEFYLIGYKFKKKLYEGELDIKAFANHFHFSMEVKRSSRGPMDMILVTSRPSYDMVWHRSLNNWIQAYIAEPPAPRRKVKRKVKFDIVDDGSSDMDMADEEEFVF